MHNPNVIHMDNDRAARQWSKLLAEANKRADWWEAQYEREREAHSLTWAAFQDVEAKLKKRRWWQK